MPISLTNMVTPNFAMFDTFLSLQLNGDEFYHNNLITIYCNIKNIMQSLAIRSYY